MFNRWYLYCVVPRSDEREDGEGEGEGAGADASSGERGEACGGEAEAGAGAEAEAGGDAEWAAALRDRLVCAVYSRLFTWLMNAVNEAIAPRAPVRRCTLGILDAYGFERLAHNGLERLLINYAAERVQACVTGATLRREQDEYAREGLAWRPLRYLDHEAHADLLDSVSVCPRVGRTEPRTSLTPRSPLRPRRVRRACWGRCERRARTYRSCSGCSAAGTRGSSCTPPISHSS